MLQELYDHNQLLSMNLSLGPMVNDFVLEYPQHILWGLRVKQLEAEILHITLYRVQVAVSVS